MTVLIFVFVAVFGLIIGSFLNAVIHRLHTKESPAKGRSYCPHCKHELKWYDLIPVVSFLFLRGRCRYCSKHISWQYPLVEIATSVLFLLIFYYQLPVTNYQLLLHVFFLFIITAFLIILFVYDLKYLLIPEKIIYPAIGVALLYVIYQALILNTLYFIPYTFFSAFGAAAFFFAIFLVSKGKWMGFGDVPLAFLIGFVLGFPGIIVALFLAFFIGAIIGVSLLVAGKKGLKSEVPFGPFLITGFFIALFWGEAIAAWYLRFL